MNHFPVFLELRDRPVLVVGGTAMAARRCKATLTAGAKVRVVAHDLSPAFDDCSGFTHEARDFRPDDIDGAQLVFVATDDEDTGVQVSALAHERGVPVNVADRRHLCSFIMPSIVDRSPVIVAVSSGGEAPILSRLLRSRLETWVPRRFGRLAQFAGDCRERVKAAIPDITRRRRFWETIVDGSVAEYILAGQSDDAGRLLEQTLAAASDDRDAPLTGEVYLVGAGPGDPDLLTFRALRLMQQADVVLHDRLVDDAVLDLVRRDAERVYVGKRRGDHELPQDLISQTLVDLAKQGKRVLRLKGGDPFTFGRGGEEIEALASHGIPFQVVPGISAANGCAAYAGIPLTHRDHAQACIFVTGHTKDGKLSLNWDSLVQPNQTVVVFMGLGAIATITRELIAHGADADLPAAVVDNATRDSQQVITGTLDNIAARVEQAELDGPAILVVGTVVRLREQLSWFKTEGL
jgi:uroporphyrin-III C-methyltransferase/precorrin-2 dehydrogenase/sirohydrochlorin ferrochelatase